MKTQLLFEKLRSIIKEKPDIENVFANSGMLLKESGMVESENAVLSYGFFPFGTGILTENVEKGEADIKEGGLMILGNDFGTLNYLKNKCSDGKENKRTSATIRNLVGKNSLELDPTKTFFTNIYLGLRTGTSMTIKMKLKKEYQIFCYNFFFEQLKFINPKTIICLGTEVGNALANIPDTDTFVRFKNAKISDLFFADSCHFIIETDDDKFGRRKFMLIPHPSFAHINWTKNEIKNKILKAINSY